MLSKQTNVLSLHIDIGGVLPSVRMFLLISSTDIKSSAELYVNVIFWEDSSVLYVYMLSYIWGYIWLLYFALAVN